MGLYSALKWANPYRWAVKVPYRLGIDMGYALRVKSRNNFAMKVLKKTTTKVIAPVAAVLFAVGAVHLFLLIAPAPILLGLGAASPGGGSVAPFVWPTAVNIVDAFLGTAVAASCAGIFKGNKKKYNLQHPSTVSPSPIGTPPTPRATPQVTPSPVVAPSITSSPPGGAIAMPPGGATPLTLGADATPLTPSIESFPPGTGVAPPRAVTPSIESLPPGTIVALPGGVTSSITTSLLPPDENPSISGTASRFLDTQSQADGTSPKTVSSNYPRMQV